MSGQVSALLLLVVVTAGTLAGGATRYERCGPPVRRMAVGALAMISFAVAMVVAVVLFGVAVWEADGAAWRVLGVMSVAGTFGGLVAARYVDHALALRSWPRAVRAVLDDVPWRRVVAAVNGTLADARRRLQHTRS